MASEIKRIIKTEKLSASPEQHIAPASWYLFGLEKEIRRAPRTKQFFGRGLVAFQTESGKIQVLDARCSHMGADLGGGKVIGETLECPFHGWRFGTDGRCIFQKNNEPACAVQKAYPTVVRHGFIFFFNGPAPLFELPFFLDADPEHFLPASPFTLTPSCPWYMIAANAFDFQHFRRSHDRQVVEEPLVGSQGSFNRFTSISCAVVENNIRDILIRLFAGDKVTIRSDVWGGNIISATATFRATKTYGLVFVTPINEDSTRVEVIAFVKKSRNLLLRKVFNPFHAAIRRLFIKAFLKPDLKLLKGTGYNPASLSEADIELTRYFSWLDDMVTPQNGFLPKEKQ